MRHWLLALEYFWINHKDDIVGLALCTAIAFSQLGVSLWMGGADLSLKPAVPHPTDGTILGIAGRGGKYIGGVTVLVRAHDNRYGFVSVPGNLGCQPGDHVTVDEWQLKSRTYFRIRPPGCSHDPA